MHRLMLFGTIILAGVFCLGIIFASESLGTNSQGTIEPAQAQATAPVPQVDYAVLGLLLGGGIVYMIRPKRRFFTKARPNK